MIAFVEGKLTIKEPTFVIIETGGIGYEIKISLNTYSSIKDEEACKLHTYLHVKEDAHTLYGFSELTEKKLFLLLISISGIGPSTALMMFSSLSTNEIKSAISNEEVTVIQSVKGIGSKTAQRVILELKDKIRKEELMSLNNGQVSPSSHNTMRIEALSALVTLGINKQQAEKSIESILQNNDEQITLEELIKRALKRS
jgi:holliday junction DNA helicase RuvA